MVLFRHPVFVQLTRKLIQSQRVKSEVIFRQCSSDALPLEKQTLQQLENVNLDKNEGKSLLKSPSVDGKDVLVNQRSEIKNLHDEKELSSLFEVHRKDFYLDDSLHGFTPKVPKALDLNTEDLSDLSINQLPSFNIAKYADKFPILQEFVKLGVQLWKLDNDPDVAKMIVSMDFEKDAKPHIQFLHDCGVPADQLGAFITKNPNIFKVDLDDLRTRIRYLRAHSFTPDMIQILVAKNPFWLSFSTKQIDTRLGYFQNEFKLNGNEVRLLAVKVPKLITYDMTTLEKKTFAFRQEMGFEFLQMRKILMTIPRLWTKCKRNLLDTFDYAHNTMKLTHETLSKQPQVLHCRKRRLEARHKYLLELKKAQYDPSMPLYVAPKTLVSGTDEEFCQNVADTSIATYNMFLKSL